MSEFQENLDLEKENTEINETEAIEESTVFSDPTAHKEKKATSKKNFAVKIISAFLIVAILAGGTFAVIKLIPEKQQEQGEEAKTSITVLSYLSKNVAEVNVVNKNGEFKLFPTKEVVDEKNTTIWHLDDIDASLTDSDSISSVATNAVSLSASREVEIKDRPLSDFGLDVPVATATVKFSDGTEGYSVTVGKVSPDNSGTYVKISNKDKVYIVDNSITDTFTFEAIDFGNADPFPPAEFEGDVSAYVDGNGVLSTFDYVTLSGKDFPEKLTIKPNTNDIRTTVVSYIATTPHKRYADNADLLLSPFSNGVTVSGSYTFDLSNESLKKYGLDNPDMIISMSVNSQVKTFKLSKVDDDFYAVINDDSKQIKKVYSAYLTIANTKAENYYNKWISMEPIKEINNYTVIMDGKTYSFDIKYYPDEEENEYVVTHNGKTLTEGNFQDFYGDFSILKCADFKNDAVQGEPSATVRLTYTMQGGTDEIKFYKVSETKYQCIKNGVSLGRVSSLDYNKFIKSVKLISEDKVTG